MNRRIYILFITIFVIVLSFRMVFAQPGSLDKSFGVNGKVILSFSQTDDIAQDVAVQADGKIVVTGFMFSDTSFKFITVRFNTDGTLDNTFGKGGKVITQIGNKDDKATSVKVDKNGSIFVGGYTWTGNAFDFALVKYKNNGVLDDRFNNNGIAAVSIGIFDDMAVSLIILGSGGIIQSGFTERFIRNDFAVVKYNSDGNLDKTFGNNGKVVTQISTFNNISKSSAIITNDGIILAGYSFSGIKNNFTTVKYDNNGILDSTFGTTGKVATEIGPGDDFANSVLIKNDNKILVSGYSFNGVQNVFTTVSYDQIGGKDSSYGINGIVKTKIGNINDRGITSVLQDDGKIIIGGVTETGNGDDFALIRFDSLGNVDNSFGTDGKVITDINFFNDTLTALAIQNDGKIIAVGGSFNGNNYDFSLVRYNNGVVTSLNDEKTNNTVPKSFSLSQNYPNPFNPGTTISFQISVVSDVTLKIYNILGKEVAILLNETKQKGNYNISFDASSIGSGLTSGVYFYRLSALGKKVNFVQTKKMILMK